MFWFQFPDQGDGAPREFAQSFRGRNTEDAGPDENIFADRFNPAGGDAFHPNDEAQSRTHGGGGAIRIEAPVDGQQDAFLKISSPISNPDLMGFDPQEMGRLEFAMWRSYYEGSWVQLACQTMEGACGQYGFSWWDGSRASLHAARAALFFRKNTDDPRCLPELEQYYAIISKATGRTFDISSAAAPELQWWKERRRRVVPKDYAVTIAQATALVYGVPEEKLLPAARMRADAMAYRDARWDGKMTDAEWQEITRQLSLAYASFKEAVTNGR